MLKGFCTEPTRRLNECGPADTGPQSLGLTRSAGYLSDVQERSHCELFSATTPLTFADSISGVLSHSHGMAGACAVICLSMSPHSCGRWSAGAISALSMAALIVSSLSCDQFELPCSRMFLPAKVGESIV